MDGAVDGWVNHWVTGFYETYIFPHMTADQKVMLVPGSFGSDVNHYPNGTYICDRECYDVMCAHDAEDFHQCACAGSGGRLGGRCKVGGCVRA